MVMRAEQYKDPLPGSPIPISFNVGANGQQSMSLNPGTGGFGQIGGPNSMFGSAQSGGGAPPQSGGINLQPDTSISVRDIVPSHLPMPVQNLQGMQVNANAYGGGGYDLGSLGGFTGMGGGGSAGGGMAPGGVHVKDLAPVHVTAQMPVQPNMFDRYMQWSNDHPVLSGMAENFAGGITGLAPVMVAAHAYYNNKHGQPLISGLGGLGSLGSSLSNLFSGAPGGPLSSNGADMYSKFLSGANGGGLGSGGGSSGALNGVLPNYPGLAANSAIPASLPGAYWNQLAIHDAAPSYGPFSGPGQHNLPIAPSGISGV